MSVIPLSWAKSHQFGRLQGPMYSDTFAVYPWMVDNKGEGLVTQTPSMMGYHLVKHMHGQTMPGENGRGLSRNLLLTHLGHLAGRGVRTVFLEVEENNHPARRLYDRAGFTVAGRRERYYRQASGEQLNALLMRRDLS